MKEYKDIENNVPDAYNAYNATALIATMEKQDQTGQIARQLRIKVEKSQLANLRVLKITSGNVAKRLKISQKCV